MDVVKNLLLLNRVSFLLDSLPRPVSAFGLRKLNRNYNGSAIRVRRSSDNAELDIGFTASGHLDVVSLLLFVGNGNGFVAIWYDQSGSGNHLIQTTASRQPRMVGSGVLTTDNNRPSIFFDGTDDVLSSTTAFINSTVANSSLTFAFISGGANSSFGFAGNAVNGGAGIPRLYFQRTSFSYANINSVTINAPSGTSLLTFQHDGINTASVFREGVFVGSATVEVSSSFAGGFLSVPLYASGVAQQGFASEAILFNSNLPPSLRQLLERNQGGYFGIPVA